MVVWECNNKICMIRILKYLVICSLFLLASCSSMYRQAVDVEVLTEPKIVAESITIAPVSLYLVGDTSQGNIQFFESLKSGLSRYFNIVDTNSPNKIIIDSLYVGKVDSQLYYDDNHDKNIEVSLPFHFKLVVKTDSSFISKKINDELYWDVLVKDKKSVDEAHQEARDFAPEIIASYGESIAQQFFPSWEKKSRTIFMFSGTKWQEAYNLASQFKWAEAREIWYQLCDAKNANQQAAAAYNIALASEVLGEYEYALEWVKFLEKFHPNFKPVTLKKRIEANL